MTDLQPPTHHDEDLPVFVIPALPPKRTKRRYIRHRTLEDFHRRGLLLRENLGTGDAHRAKAVG